MKTDFLFPHVYKTIGWWLLVIFGVLYVLTIFGVIDDDAISFPTLALNCDTGMFAPEKVFGFNNEGMVNEIAMVGLSVALLLVSFSRENDEDEYITSMRFGALVWACKVNTVIFILGTWFIFGWSYLVFMLFWIFLLFVLYIAKFQSELYCFRRSDNEE